MDYDETAAKIRVIALDSLERLLDFDDYDIDHTILTVVYYPLKTRINESRRHELQTEQDDASL